MALYGYARVSTSEQDLTLQTQILRVVKSFAQKKPVEAAGPEGMRDYFRNRQSGEGHAG